MDKHELKLIFVTKVGEIYDETDIYEFIFSDNSDEAIGYGWEMPCLNNVEPPKDTYQTMVATLKSGEVVLSLLEEQYEFRYLDGVFGFISLAWEYIEDYQMLDSLNDVRVCFKYGDTLEEVEKKLAYKKLSLDY
jgi:hypothetical protein